MSNNEIDFIVGSPPKGHFKRSLQDDMKTILIIACLASALGCARESGKSVSFPFTFPADSDGCAALHVRKLSTSQKQSIHFNVNLMDSGHSLRPLLAGTEGPLVFELSPTQTVASCWIDELPARPDGFRWGHFMPPTNLLDRWTAISGTATVTATRHPDGNTKPGFLASVHLSDVVFQSSNTMYKTTLDSLAFTNVHVGWWVK